MVAAARSYMVTRKDADIESDLTTLVAVAEDVSYMTGKEEHGLYPRPYPSLFPREGPGSRSG